MSTTNQNKEVIQSLCTHLGNRDAAGAITHLAEDGYWTINGDPESFSFAGKYDKPSMAELLSGFLGSFKSFEFHVLSITAEENRVAVEAYSKGEGNDSRIYENQYLMLYRLRDRQIVEAKEFFDPFAVLKYVG